MYTIEEIITKTKIHPLRVKNIYTFGSQVYGTADEQSDFDYICVCSTMQNDLELKPDGDDMNIHLITPDSFKDRLLKHDILYLECVFAPKEFRLLEKTDFLSNFKLDINRLKNVVYGESVSAWKKAKTRFGDGDYYRGIKGIFHGLRLLDFGLQICEHGKIINYSSMNHIWKELVELEYDEYYDYKEKYFKLKIQLEKKLRNFK